MWLKRFLAKAHEVGGKPVSFRLLPGSSEEISRSGQLTLMRTYDQVASAFDGVSMTATDCATVPIGVFRKIKGSRTGKMEECGDHPMLERLANPNSRMTQFELIEATVAYPMLTGDGFWILEDATTELDRTLTGDFPGPLWIHVERPDFIEVESPKKTEDRNFRRKDHGTLLNPEAVIQFKLFNPLSTLSGIPPLLSAGKVLTMELYLDVFGRDFYQRSIRPSFIFTSDSPGSNLAFDRFRVWMSQEHGGLDRHHNAMFIPGGIKPVDVKMTSPQDSAFDESLQRARQRILMSLGAYHLVAIAQGKSGENIKEATRNYWHHTVAIKLKQIEQRLTKDFLPKFDDNDQCVVKFKTLNHPGFQEDFSVLTTGLFRMIQAQVMSHERAAELLGEEPLQEGQTTGLGHQPARSRFEPNEFRAATEEMTKQDIIDGVVQELRLYLNRAV